MSLPIGIDGGLAVTGAALVLPPDAPGGRAQWPGGPPDDWFDHRTRLGPRGYKYLPAAAQYLLAAARGAAADGGGIDLVPEDRRGSALALNGALAGLFDRMDRQVAAEGGANALSPATAPYFAASVLGSRLAAEHGLKGFALTLAAPGTAALEAVEAGARALAAGRCDALFVGAAEHALPKGAGEPGEQGAAALVLEPPAAAEARGAAVHGLVRARSLHVPPRSLAEGAGRARLTATVTGALDRLLAAAGPGARAPEPHYVLDGSPVAALTRAAVDGVLAIRPAAPPTPGALAPGAPPGAVPLGAGSLAAAVGLVRLVTGEPGDRLLVVAGGRGHIAFVLLSALGRPPVRPHGPEREGNPC
ncbi:beta-ketoacyl synthase N-terminal-like domain-containing protein [Streptomyces sp. NBC_01244]|uniref:beta-ketoacyl synthase N-terminal-like domain-containing protein n=1 Tax=Streptomyces sp. NBC_01244 TaxID=2903797 RepID=UPI002E14B745|nr:3-oxoacyl-ACP synthase [Streptomyces sp. NBC_01244]